jgi:hypothetical protein
MNFLKGNSEVLDRLVTEMYARGLSTRNVEDAFRDDGGHEKVLWVPRIPPPSSSGHPALVNRPSCRPEKPRPAC